MKQVFANRKCLDDSSSSDSFVENQNQTIQSISSNGVLPAIQSLSIQKEAP